MNYQQIADDAQRNIEAGKIAEGITILRRAIRKADQEGEREVQGALLSGLGMAQKRAGNPACRDTLIEAIRLLEQAEANKELTTAWGNLGFIESDLGNLEEAKYCHEQALHLARSRHDEEEEAHALMNLSILFKDYYSQLTKALAYSEQALHLLTTQDNPRDKAHTLLSLGLINERLQRIAEARKCYEQALPLYRKVEDRQNEAATLHNLAQLLDSEGDYLAALDLYQQSFEINVEIDDKWGKAADLSSLGSLLQGVQEWEQARQFHDAAFALQKKIGDRRGQIDSLTDLGIIAGHLGEFRKAIHYLNRALRLAHNIFDLQSAYQAYAAKGDVDLQARHPVRAIASYRQAVSVTESLRARLLMEQEALSFFTQDRLLVYERLVYVYQRELHKTREALLWGERSKMREFLRRLGTTELAVSGSAPAAMLEKEAQLMSRLRSASLELAAGGGKSSSPNRVDIVKEYEEAEAAVHDVWADISAYDAEYVALRRGEPASWEDLLRCLSPT